MREQSLLLETWNNPQSIKHSVMLSWNPMAVWSTSLLLFFFFSQTEEIYLTWILVIQSTSPISKLTLWSPSQHMQFLVHEINKSINYSIGRNKNPLPFYKSFYIFTIVRKAGYIDQSGSTVRLSKSLPPQDSEGTHRDGSRSLISEAELLSINSLFPTTAWNNMHHLRLLLQVLVLGQLSGNL